MPLQIPSQYLKTVFKNYQKFWIGNIHNLASTCNKSTPHPCLKSAVRKKMEGLLRAVLTYLFFFFLIIFQSSPSEK